MKKRVVPFETVETFLDTMRIMFYSSPNQPDYNGIREIFFRDSFEVESEDEHESEVRMTDKTRELFDAPWKARECPHVYAVNDASGELKAETFSAVCANRLARLPELYDALMHFVVNDCPHAFISNDECRLCSDKKCKTREAVELLRKVRDGE